jgi:uncharacterized protein YeaO (DUF488 family)
LATEARSCRILSDAGDTVVRRREFGCGATVRSGTMKRRNYRGGQSGGATDDAPREEQYGHVVAPKRAYDAADWSDGARVLVERLGPRAVRKADLPLDGWLRDVAPSPEFRRCFGHDPWRWAESRRRLLAALRKHEDALEPLPAAARQGPNTFVYSARHAAQRGRRVARAPLRKRSAP